MFRRAMTVMGAAGVTLAITVGSASACGGLIGARGSVNLLRTTTLAGYADGVEHYVTSFEFAGAGGAFGSITPLPGIPSEVVKGGKWTLQRLVRETAPKANFRSSGSGASALQSLDAEVLIDVDIDALDVTVLKGGAEAIGKWAKDNGFRLPPDAPEVLDFYARRSPIFMAARFDPSRAAAREQQLGDGTPVHLTIPTTNPWVPLRILGLGKAAEETVQADVYLLTESRPALLTVAGTKVVHDARATDLLLDDLRGDDGMEWVPEQGWLTKIAIDGPAGELTKDLAIDASGQGRPSLVAAGYELPQALSKPRESLPAWSFAVVGLLLGAGLVAVAVRSRELPTGA